MKAHDRDYIKDEHYHIEDGTTKAKKDATSKSKKTVVYSTFIDRTEHCNILISKKEIKRTGVDKIDARNRMAETVLRFLQTERGWDMVCDSLQYGLPEIPFSTKREDPVEEFKRLCDKRKWEKERKVDCKYHVHNYQSCCRITIPGISIKSFKDVTFDGWSTNQKQAHRNACDSFLTKYEEYKSDRDNKHKEDSQKNKHEDQPPSMGDVSSFLGVLNENKKFIKIQPNDFAKTELVVGENSSNNSRRFLDRLCLIGRREQFSFRIMAVESKRDEDDTLEGNHMETLDETTEEVQTEEAPLFQVHQCILETNTKPRISVFGIGETEHDAQEQAAQMALYSLQIQCASSNRYEL